MINSLSPFYYFIFFLWQQPQLVATSVTDEKNWALIKNQILFFILVPARNWKWTTFARGQWWLLRRAWEAIFFLLYIPILPSWASNTTFTAEEMIVTWQTEREAKDVLYSKSTLSRKVTRISLKHVSSKNSEQKVFLIRLASSKQSPLCNINSW